MDFQTRSALRHERLRERVASVNQGEELTEGTDRIFWGATLSRMVRQSELKELTKLSVSVWGGCSTAKLLSKEAANCSVED